MKRIIVVVTIISSITGATLAFLPSSISKSSSSSTAIQARISSRRQILDTIGASSTAAILVTTSTANPSPANAAAAIQDSLEVEEFLRTGVDGGGNMGVSSQAGKSRPQTGVVFRDGTEVLQNKRGDVSAEILTGTKKAPTSVLVSFNAPYKLETGSVFDVECRDGKSGDGAFLAVTESTNGKSLNELPSSFFMERLFSPTGVRIPLYRALKTTAILNHLYLFLLLLTLLLYFLFEIKAIQFLWASH